jgi:hypothetical protein
MFMAAGALAIPAAALTTTGCTDVGAQGEDTLLTYARKDVQRNIKRFKREPSRRSQHLHAIGANADMLLEHMKVQNIDGKVRRYLAQHSVESLVADASAAHDRMVETVRADVDVDLPPFDWAATTEGLNLVKQHGVVASLQALRPTIDHFADQMDTRASITTIVFQKPGDDFPSLDQIPSKGFMDCYQLGILLAVLGGLMLIPAAQEIAGPILWILGMAYAIGCAA